MTNTAATADPQLTASTAAWLRSYPNVLSLTKILDSLDEPITSLAPDQYMQFDQIRNVYYTAVMKHDNAVDAFAEVLMACTRRQLEVLHIEAESLNHYKYPDPALAEGVKLLWEYIQRDTPADPGQADGKTAPTQAGNDTIKETMAIMPRDIIPKRHTTHVLQKGKITTVSVGAPQNGAAVTFLANGMAVAPMQNAERKAESKVDADKDWQAVSAGSPEHGEGEEVDDFVWVE